MFGVEIMKLIINMALDVFKFEFQVLVLMSHTGKGHSTYQL